MGNHNSISRKLYLSLALMLTISLTSVAQDATPTAPVVAPVATVAPAVVQGGDPVKGKDLFHPTAIGIDREVDPLIDKHEVRAGPALLKLALGQLIQAIVAGLG